MFDPTIPPADSCYPPPAFQGNEFSATGGDAGEWEEPDESLFATEEELLALQEESASESSPETEEGG